MPYLHSDLWARLSRRLHKENCHLILIAPAWPKQVWFPDLLRLSCVPPFLLPPRRDLLSHFRGKVPHQHSDNLHLHLGCFHNKPLEREFSEKQPSISPGQSENKQILFINNIFLLVFWKGSYSFPSYCQETFRFSGLSV